MHDKPSANQPPSLTNSLRLMQTFVFLNGCLKNSRISNIPLGLGLEFGLGLGLGLGLELGLGLGLELGLGLGLELWLLKSDIENNIWRHLLNILKRSHSRGIAIFSYPLIFG